MPPDSFFDLSATLLTYPTQCLRDHLKHKLITVHGNAWLYRVYAFSIGFAMHLLRPVPATAIAAYLVELNIQF